jgi:chromosome segregation ATPase
MGRLAAFTPEQVYEAAGQLFAAGQDVTPKALRDSLGKGSYATFVKHIEEWKKTRQAPVLAVTFVMPDEVKSAFDRAWLAATSEAGKEIALIREKSDAEVKAARRGEADAIAATVELEKEIEAESALVQAGEDALLKEREAHQQLASDLAAKIAVLNASADQMREQIDTQKNEMQRLHTEESRLHEQLAQAAEKLEAVGARERLKIEEAATAKADCARTKEQLHAQKTSSMSVIGKLEESRKTMEATISELHKENRRLTESFGQATGELTALRNQVAEHAITKSELATLRNQLAQQATAKEKIVDVAKNKEGKN